MRMSTEYSPAPWINCNTHVDDALGRTIMRSTVTFDELLPADFALAAAAPDLLAACEEIVDLCKVRGMSVLTAEIAMIAMVAIAKAKGGG
jgi:hypothetical protein